MAQEYLCRIGPTYLEALSTEQTAHPMAKLLLCEDEQALAQTLAEQLRSAGHIVDVAANGEEGGYLAHEFEYDLWVLDIGLPKVDGLTLLKALRAEGKTTLALLLTARNNWQDRVLGLKSGADDYLGKPFHFEELLARIEALLKRPPQRIETTLKVGPFELQSNQRVLVDHQTQPPTTHNLTKTEFIFLQTFFQAPGYVFSKDQLLQKLGDQYYERESNLVEVYVRKLRQYLGRERIQTLRGQGYRLVA